MSKIHTGCPACGSFVSYDSAEKAKKTIINHNYGKHDGRPVARQIFPDSEEDVNKFVKEAHEKAPGKQNERIIRDIVQGKTPYTVGVINGPGN